MGASDLCNMIARILFITCLLGYLTDGNILKAISSDENSCEGRCDDSFDASFPCQCNSACVSHSDCCSDYGNVCQEENSCKGKCGADYDHNLPCQCNDKCGQYGNCCSDYDEECGGSSGGGLSDQDLLELSELLFSMDANNVGSKIELNLQCTTHEGSSEDCSPEPLFTSVDESVLQMPMYVKLSALYDNYVASPGVVEDHTEEEQTEEMKLLEEITSTSVMQNTYQFLVDKGVFTGSLQEWQRYLYDTWFGMYDRAKFAPLNGGTTLGSSGFEHVFIGEIKKEVVSGFHNWFHWYWLEKADQLNYLGYWEKAEFGGDMKNGGGISFTYTWNGTPKPYGSMFIGTSPELEMAIYTTCLMTRPDAKCHITLGGTDVFVQTWTFTVGSNVYVGSSYPDWKL